MSSQHSNFAEKFAATLQKMNRGASGAPEINDTNRLATLLEAATATFDLDDPRAVEGVFAVQALSLDVIFRDFIRRKLFTFENMRVALRAQAQCRATFKTLSDFKHPRLKSKKFERTDC